MKMLQRLLIILQLSLTCLPFLLNLYQKAEVDLFKSVLQPLQSHTYRQEVIVEAL